MMVEQLGPVLLFLPAILAAASKNMSIYAIGVGFLLAVLYALLLKKITKEMQGDFIHYAEHTLGAVSGKLLRILYSVSCLLGSGWMLYQTTELVKTSLLENGNFMVLSMITGGLLLYNLMGSYEANKRVVSLLTIGSLVPLILALVCNADRIQWKLLLPGKLTMPLHLDQSILLVFGSCICLFLFPLYVQKEKKKIIRGLLIEGIIVIFVFLLLESTFGVQGLAESQWPILNLASTGNVPFGGPIRLEPLLSGSFYLALFSTLSLLGFTGKKLRNPETGQSSQRDHIQTILWVGISWVIAEIFYFFPKLLLQVEMIYWVVGIGMFTLLPPILYFLGTCRAKRKIVGVLLVTMVVLSGCQGELKEKLFVSAVAVDEEALTFISPMIGEATGDKKGSNEGEKIRILRKDIQDVQAVKGKQSNKTPELSHTKAIIISETIAKDHKKMEPLWKLFLNAAQISRNTFVFTVSDGDMKKLASTPAVEGDLGTYLMELMDGGTHKNNGAVRLNDVIYAWQNHTEYPVLPRIYIENKRPQLE
ncbi:MAG: GerAB/ArcD/ProY family transporter [Lachnospiraceae bacterium]